MSQMNYGPEHRGAYAIAFYVNGRRNQWSARHIDLLLAQRLVAAWNARNKDPNSYYAVQDDPSGEGN